MNLCHIIAPALVLMNCVCTFGQSTIGKAAEPNAQALILEQWDKLRDAALERKIDVIFDHATRQGRDSITGYTAIMVGTTIAKTQGNKNLEDLLATYGLSGGEIVKRLVQSKDITIGCPSIGRSITDQSAFIKEVWKHDFNSSLPVMFVGARIQEIKFDTGGLSAMATLDVNPFFAFRYQLVDGRWLVHAVEPGATHRIMSFNIRYGTANDGENHWDKRKDFVVETIKAFKPDLLGTQETLAFQRDYLLKNMEGYEAFGISREDGKDKGEMTTVFYRKDRFEKIEGATFWLSETPEVIASKGWDTSLPRICTWIKLRDLKVKDSPAICFYNTHFDHRGPKARLESAKLIRQHITALGAEARVILTGDFNADEGSEPYKALFADQDGKASSVLDTLRVFKPVRGDDEGSFNSFGPAPGKARIDWVGVSKHWHIISAAIDRTQKNGRWPSDHFPVTAVIRAK